MVDTENGTLIRLPTAIYMLQSHFNFFNMNKSSFFKKGNLKVKKNVLTFKYFKYVGLFEKNKARQRSRKTPDNNVRKMVVRREIRHLLLLLN